MVSKKIVLIFLVILFSSCYKKGFISDFQYYKKIPEIRGVTIDDDNRIFILDVILVYETGNVQTLRAIGANKDIIADGIRKSLSRKTHKFLIDNNNEAQIKEDLKVLINKIIDPNDSNNSVKMVLISKLFVHDYH